MCTCLCKKKKKLESTQKHQNQFEVDKHSSALSLCQLFFCQSNSAKQIIAKIVQPTLYSVFSINFEKFLFTQNS